MTGVRSFDIKAYDNSLAGYADLGWGDDLRLTSQLVQPACGSGYGTWQPPTWLATTMPFSGPTSRRPCVLQQRQVQHADPDLRPRGADAAAGQTTTASTPSTGSVLPAPRLLSRPTATSYTGNIGDDNPAVVRLRRVWDSWSTEYTQAPGTGVNPDRHRLPRSSRPARRTAADLSVVSAALPGAAAGHPDPDPGHRPDQSAYQDIDHPSGFHGQVVRRAVVSVSSAGSRPRRRVDRRSPGMTRAWAEEGDLRSENGGVVRPRRTRFTDNCRVGETHHSD